VFFYLRQTLARQVLAQSSRRGGGLLGSGFDRDLGQPRQHRQHRRVIAIHREPRREEIQNAVIQDSMNQCQMIQRWATQETGPCHRQD
jgi:hypothetical protein